MIRTGVARDFPVLSRDFPNGPLVYLDNACTTLRPRPVIDAVTQYYEEAPVCGERSVHRLGHEVTHRVEDARAQASDFFGARGPQNVVFTKNATEGINLVAHGIRWKKGDVVVTTDKEHNSNWIPWLHRRDTLGIRVLTLPSERDGTFDLGKAERVIARAGKRLRLLSLVHVSNADGVETPVRPLAKLAKEQGALTMADAAQSAGSRAVTLGSLGVDLLVASAHKMLGPGGVGFLAGRAEALGSLGPFQLGGNTVKQSRADGYDWQDLPSRFEAGLQNYASLWALPAMFDYLGRKGLSNIAQHTRRLNVEASKRLSEIPGLVIHGPRPEHRAAILPFTLPPLDPHVVAVYLDEARTIAVRSGAHCVHSFFERRRLPGWVRASFHLYNTSADVAALGQSLEALSKGLSKGGEKVRVRLAK